MHKVWRVVIVIATGVLFVTNSVTFAQKADLSAQWEVAKVAAVKYGIETGSIPSNALGFPSDTVDSDTFRELKKTFESESGIRAVLLVENGSTWVFQRYNRYWWPIVWGGVVSAPLVAIGLINDKPAAVTSGVILGLIGAGVGIFTWEKSEVSNIKNDFKGSSAVFILRQ